MDTQDYINLFTQAEDARCHHVLRQLLSWRDEGRILVGFSFFTIVEFITKPDEDNREERVARGRLIKNICGKNAFPHPTDWMLGARFPNHGMWLGRPENKLVKAAKVRKQIFTNAKAELAKQQTFNRAKRREMAKPKNIIKLLGKLDPDWASDRSVWQGIPVSNQIIESRLFERFVRGDCSDQEFERALNSWLTDPEEFSRLVYDYGGTENIKDAYFSASFVKITEAVKVLSSLQEKIRKHNSDLLEARKVFIDRGLDPKIVRKRLKQYSLPQSIFDSVEKRLEAVVGKGRAGHFRHYCYQLSKKPDQFKESDAFDLMHLSYVYDCDLMRCDKAMASTFKDFEPFKGKLVSRFEDLPGRIEGMLGRIEGMLGA